MNRGDLILIRLLLYIYVYKVYKIDHGNPKSMKLG